MNYLVANWKSFKTLEKVEEWLSVIKGISVGPDTAVIVCPPFPYIEQVNVLIEKNNLPFELGVQDISPYPFGKYTGAVTAEMVKEWVSYAIVGHSERRRYFHETDQEVANKVAESLQMGITPIVCVDKPYLDSQLAALEKDHLKNILVAYEPLEAIGSGEPEKPEAAQQVALEIKQSTDANVPVLYGGSTTPENISGYLEQRDINGVLVGGTSLDVEKWKQIILAV